MHNQSIKADTKQIIDSLELELKSEFERIDKISELNHKKVAQAFKKARISSEHFNPTSGYGHDDLGREKFDELFALVFGTESAIARVNIVSGTHAIGCALLGNLRVNEEIIFALGKPYDTLENILEYIRNNLNGQVTINHPQDWQNITQISEEISSKITNRTKIIAIQRSRGYATDRPSFSVAEIAKLIEVIKVKNKNIIIFVDNCYGEFVEEFEPTQFGADLMAGSLIKNPGGGIVLTGGYVVGKKDLVNNAANRLTCPGVGSEGGPNFNQGRLLFQGLYMAPLIVSQALKSMVLAAKTLEHLGFASNPSSQSVRTDIIQRIDFGSREKLINFCKLLQANSPIDSHLTPFPAQTPGYQDELIMAAGTFIEGSTIELSADGPLREPYSAFLQGGLSYQYTKLFLEEFINYSIVK